MPVYKKESLESLRNRIDLVDVLESHVELKKAGASYKGLCPFHDEKTPSFTVQRGDSHYHCFGCGAHGDAIQFLIDHVKMTFTEAVEHLAMRYQVPLERVEGDEQEKGHSKKLLHDALEEACKIYHTYLLHSEEGQSALKYLYQRGIDLDFIRLFHIGLAPKEHGVFRPLMWAKKISNEIMCEAGLLKDSGDGKFKDFFYDRITFPIYNPVGRIIGFSARKYREETFGGKYVNTSETSLFKKSKVLYGLNYCRRTIAKERQAMIVEGQIDCLRLIHGGLTITVAGQGTAFGEGHAHELIQLGITRAFLALDPDHAGQEATAKIGNLFQKQGVDVTVIKLPIGSDPDVYVRQKGIKPFMDLMERGNDYLTFMVDHLSKSINIQTPAGKNELVHQLTTQIRTWDDPVMVHESLKKLANLLQVPEDLITAGTLIRPVIHAKQAPRVGIEEINPDQVLETDLLRWLLLTGHSNPQFYEIAKANLNETHFHCDACKKIYLALIKNPQEQTLTSLMVQIDDPNSQQILTTIHHKKINRDKAQELYEETVQRMLDRRWLKERDDIANKIRSSTISETEMLALIKRFDELKQKPRILHG